MSMKDDLTKEVGPTREDDYDKVVEEVEDEKYGRKRFVVRRVQKAGDNDEEDYDGTNTIQETIFFQKRTEDLLLDKNVGSRLNTTKDAEKSQHGGYHCQLCDTHVWDSNAWLDHLNGKKHARLLGMNNKVEKVTITDIKAKLQSLKEEKQMRNRVFEELNEDHYTASNDASKKAKKVRQPEETDETSIPKPSKKLKQDDEQQAAEQKQKQNQKTQKAQQDNSDQDGDDDEDEEDEDPNVAMMAMLGLPTAFQPSKSKR